VVVIGGVLSVDKSKSSEKKAKRPVHRWIQICG